MIELIGATLGVSVDEKVGGRLASLMVGGVERLLTRERTDGDVLQWGAYPMVPWAGRVRRGRFAFGGRAFELPLRMAPHAIHGTVLDRPWTVESVSPVSVTLRIDLGPDWPWPGHVEHEVSLVGDDAVSCRLAVHAHDTPFPAQVGWHPWFADGDQPPTLVFSAATMYERDADYIASGRLVEPSPHPWDDCFTGVAAPPRVRYRDGVELELTSDCDHWVVFEPAHALCVEPQSGPPDAFTLAPVTVRPGQPLERRLTLRSLRPRLVT